jgi:hypothetical protein
MPHTKADHGPVRRVLLWAGFLVIYGALALQVARLARPGVLPVDDFLGFWAPARLILTGGNPYAASQLLPLEHIVGLPATEPMRGMFNPPWALAFVMPFGIFSHPAGRIVWLSLSFVVLMFCAGLTWRLYQGPGRYGWLPYAVAATFVPTLSVLASGQIGFLILLGLVGFLYFERRGKETLAGMALVSTLIKPQLVYLVPLALLLWSISRRRWRMLLGMTAATATATAVAFIVDHNVFAQYFDSMQGAPFGAWAMPTLGGLARLFFGFDRVWLQFVPVPFGIVWLLLHWRRRRATWSWLAEMPLLLLVSVVTTAYAGDYDQVVLMIPVLQVFTWLVATRWSFRPTMVLGVYVAINGLNLAFIFKRIFSFFLFWVPSAWLLWYVYAARTVGRQPRQQTGMVDR